MKSNVLLAVVLFSATASMGCEKRPPSPVAPDSVAPGSLDAAPGSGGTKLVGDVVLGEYPFAIEDATRLVSRCAVSAGHTWSLDAAHTQCLIVQPDWNPASSYAPYALTDDVKLITLQDKSSKRITHVRILAQDVIGEAGIQHDTDWIPVAVPVVADRNGGTLHVHAANIEVWRLSGHTDGVRVEVIGRISIGDVLYR